MTAEKRAEPTPGPYEIWGEDEQVPGVPCIEIGRGKVPSPEAKSLCLVQATLCGDKFSLTKEDWANAELLRASWDTAAERDKLKGELQHVDAVLARRPALDDKPERIDKILHAVKIAAERDRLKAANKKLLTAVITIANSYWTDGEPHAERVEDLQKIARDAVHADGLAKLEPTS